MGYDQYLLEERSVYVKNRYIPASEIYLQEKKYCKDNCQFKIS